MDINDVTYAINGAVFEVNRVLGPGFLEKVYENALLIELKRKGSRQGVRLQSKFSIAEVKRMVLNLPEGHDTQ